MPMYSLSRAVVLLALPLVYAGDPRVPTHGHALSDKEIAGMQDFVKEKRLPFKVGRNPATQRPISQLCGLVPPADDQKTASDSGDSARRTIGATTTTTTTGGVGKKNAKVPSPSQSPSHSPSPSPAKNNPKAPNLNMGLVMDSPSPMASESPSPMASESPSPPARSPLPSPPDMPLFFDWRDYMPVVPARDQAGCASCWAFMATGQLELLTAINTGVVNDLSEQFLVSCNDDFNPNYDYNCVSGWLINDMHRDTISGTGIQGGARAEGCYPYVANDTNCTLDCGPVDFITNWNYVAGVRPSNDAVKQALYTYGPLGTVVYVDSLYQSYVSGIFTNETGATVANHGVVIVGWGTDPDVGEYWITRNSWGSRWGESGYMRIKFGVALIGEYAHYIEHATGQPVKRGVDVGAAASPPPSKSSTGDDAVPVAAWIALGVFLGVIALLATGGVVFYHRRMQKQVSETVFVAPPLVDPEIPKERPAFSTPTWMNRVLPNTPATRPSPYSPL